MLLLLALTLNGAITITPTVNDSFIGGGGGSVSWERKYETTRRNSQDDEREKRFKDERERRLREDDEILAIIKVFLRINNN